MTPREQWAEELARCRYERGAYAKRAAFWRERALEYRRRRNWLAALAADDKASEYRKTRDQYTQRANEIRQQWKLR